MQYLAYNTIRLISRYSLYKALGSALMPNILVIAPKWQSGVPSQYKHRAHQATIGLFESTAAGGGPTAGGGAGTYASSQHGHIRGEAGGRGKREYPYIQPRILRHHSLYTNPHALNHSQ